MVMRIAGQWLGALLSESILDAGRVGEHVLSTAWYAVKMKLGLVSLGAVATLGGLVNAQCPDFTTFSQVSPYVCLA